MLKGRNLFKAPLSLLICVAGASTYRSLYLFGYSLILISAANWAFVALTRPAHMMVWLIVGMSFYEVGLYILYFAPWNVFPFIPDLDTLVTGKNRAGLFASVMTFINQISQGLASVVAGYLLDFAHFRQSASGAVSQPASATNMIISLLPVVLDSRILLAMFSAASFPLKQEDI